MPKRETARRGAPGDLNAGLTSGASTTPTIARLPIDCIRTDGGTQPRADLSPEAIGEYAESISSGAKFPPITVFFDGESYWLADGFHRLQAHIQAECNDIQAAIYDGSLEVARWFACAANQTHGLRRSNLDKQRAVQAALAHPRAATMSDTEIARHCGVDHKTVASWRARILGNSQDAPPASTRTVTRGGTTYELDTENIGRRKEKPPPEIEPLPDANSNPEPAAARSGHEAFQLQIRGEFNAFFNGYRRIYYILERLEDVNALSIRAACSDGESRELAKFARAAAARLNAHADALERPGDGGAP